MRRSTRKVLAVAFVLLFAAAAAAQMPMQGPSISMHGFWSPVVGSGAAYSVEVKGQPKQEIEIGIVGSETVGGKPGYWLEMATREPRVGLMVVKTLVMLQAKDLQVQRTIVQSGDDPPIEFTTQMMPQQPEKQVADISEEAERVGTETITVPAGTFSCEHWRAKNKSYDVWISDKVQPYGVVKNVTPDTTMTLLRQLSNVKTKIRGTPQKFDMGEMMRRQRP